MRIFLTFLIPAILVSCAPTKPAVQLDSTAKDSTQTTDSVVVKDSTVIEKDSVGFKKFPDRLGYTLGLQTGESLSQLNIEYSVDAFVEGLRDQLESKDKKMTEEEMRRTRKEMEEVMRKGQSLKSENNLKKGEAFLVENLKDSTVTATNSGLQYKILREGDGKTFPNATQDVTVHYVGTLLNGKVFDSSVKRGQPATFPLNKVIPGWTEGVQLMSVGSKFRFFIPSNLAYGSRGAGGDIGPNETLIFEVELLAVK